MRVVGYVRVSTAEQAASGLSLEAQTEAIRRWAAAYGHDLVEVVEDRGFSAGSLDRPGWRRVIERLGFRSETEAVDCLVVAKLDRLTRSVLDLHVVLGELRRPRRPVALVSLAENLDTETAGGRLTLNVLASVAEWERDAIRERTRTALRAKRARGEAAGGSPPRGLRRAGRLWVEDPAEQRLVERARALRADGLSLRQVSAQLAAEGHLGRTGQPLTPTAVRRAVEGEGS